MSWYNDPLLYDFILRLLGRVSFTVLLLAIYQLWALLASPVLKQHTKTFIKVFAVLFVVSVVITSLDYYVISPWWTVFSLAFNVSLVFLLAGYLNYQTRGIKYKTEASKFREYSNALDALLLSLKR